MQKNFGKIFWLIFKNFQPEFLDIGKKKWPILNDLEKLKKKKSAKMKIWVGSAHKTGFVCLCGLMLWYIVCVISAFWSFSEDARLCSKFFCFFTVFKHHISFIKIELLWLQIYMKCWIMHFTCIFQINRKLNFEQMLVMALFYSHDDRRA